ncbi:MAG: DUF5777 family beta-barrel protein [Flavobacteriales bacterium]
MKVLKTIKSVLLGLSCFCVATQINAQDDAGVGKTFYDTRIVNGQSVETNNEGVMKFIIAHRFGPVNGGAFELYGLDQSTIRIGFDYGITDRISVGIGRSSNEKTFDGFVKGKLITQKKENGSPVTVTWFSGVAARGLRFTDPEVENKFEHRLAYSHQLLVARKWGDRLSTQLMPSFVHRNLVRTAEENNDIISIGGAARYVASKKFTFSVEYYYALPDMLTSSFENSLAIGIDWETKGHVFQFHFGNSLGMTEKFFIGETTGSWLDGDVRFGFNITRDFKIKGRKSR